MDMEPIILILLGLALFLAFSIGSQDQTFAMTVGSGSLHIKRSVIMGGILAFFGTLLLSKAVGKTLGVSLLGKSVDFSYDIIVAIIAGTALWIIIASLMGVPISTTHTIVGSVFGISFVWSWYYNQPYILSMNWTVIGMVVIGWFLSPLMGYYGAIIITYIVKRSLRNFNHGFLHIEKYEAAFRYLIILFTCINQLSRSGNDSANALGIFYSLLEFGEIDNTLMPYVVVMVGLMYMMGLFLIARRVITNVGYSTGDLRPSEAVTIESSTAIVLFLATILGFPVSGTHIAIFSLFGNAKMRGESPDRKGMVKMIISWIVTFPIGAIFSAFVYYMLLVVI
jgi:PiT family inorganic phosphate transporter